MLTLAAVAIFPIAFVSYVVVRDEVGNVTRAIDFDVREAAVAAQTRVAQLLEARELHAVAAASSPPVQTAIRRRATGELERLARRNGVLLEVDGRLYGRRVSHAVTARVPLASRGRTIGSVIAQLPVRAATLKRLGTPAARGVRLVFVDLGGASPPGPAHELTVPLANHIGIRAYLPGRLASDRTEGAYRRVAGGGALAVLALMLLTFALARPLLRAFRWTEEQASKARIDSLTGLANRRALEEILAAELSRAQRFEHQLAVVILDLDRFKEINDSFGHAAGDMMLRTVSRLLTSLARQGDTVVRWGGEEFVVVLPETDLAGAHRFAERLRRGIEASPVGEMRTSASCGVAAMLPEDSADSLLSAADQALYKAKSNGRNRTESVSRGSSAAA